MERFILLSISASIPLQGHDTINHATPNLGGFSGQLAYSLGEVPGNNSAGRQIGLSAGYANGPISVLVAHHNQKLLSGTAPDGDAKTTLLGGAYDFGVAKEHAA